MCKKYSSLIEAYKMVFEKKFDAVNIENVKAVRVGNKIKLEIKLIQEDSVK